MELKSVCLFVLLKEHLSCDLNIRQTGTLVIILHLDNSTGVVVYGSG